MSDKYWPNPDDAPYGVARLGKFYRPIDIIEKFPKKKREIHTYYGPVMVGFIGGAGLLTGFNYVRRQTLIHRPWLTVLWGIVSASLVHFTYEFRERALIRQEAICRDYIRLHPDRFPLTERKKFGECLHQWHEERMLG